PAESASLTPEISDSERNLVTPGERQLSSSGTAQTRPLAPSSTASSTSPSSSARESSCLPALSPRTTAPPSIAPRNALNSDSRKISASSRSSSPNRRSGLSEP